MAAITQILRSDTPEAAHPRRWWVLAVLCLSVLMVTIDNTIVNVALPTLSRELHASTSDLQWVVDAYSLVFAGLLLVGGGLGDRFGRKRMLQAGLVLFVATSFVASRAGTTAELIGARVGMGAAAALIYPATLALLTAVFTDRREKATAIGIWSGISGLAVALGPVGGGLLLEHFSWGSVFLVNVPLGAATIIIGSRLLPEARNDNPGRFDVIGAVLSVASIGLLVYTVIEAPTRGWASWPTLAGFAGTAAGVAAFVRWETGRTHPLIDLTLFRNARFSAASGAIAMAFFGLFGFIFLITQYFQAVRGYDTLRAGIATLPFALVVGVCSPLAIVLMKRLGTKLVVAAGLMLMSAGFAIAAVVAVDAPYWGPIIAAMVLMAGGLALVTSPATEAIMGALPLSQAGTGSAVNDTTREVGGALGVAVVGSLMNSVYRPNLADAWGALGMPQQAIDDARHSIIAALTVTDHLPAPVAGDAADAARLAFTEGLHAGSAVAAVATALAAIGAIVFLPARETRRTSTPAGSD